MRLSIASKRNLSQSRRVFELKVGSTTMNIDIIPALIAGGSDFIKKYQGADLLLMLYSLKIFFISFDLLLVKG